MRATVFNLSNVITIGGGGTVGVAASVRTIWKPEPRLGLCPYYVGRISGGIPACRSIMVMSPSASVMASAVTVWDGPGTQCQVWAAHAGRKVGDALLLPAVAAGAI